MTAVAILLGCTGNLSASDAPKLPPLTTVSGSPRLPGKFVWADLVTDDLLAAHSFYSKLFGWNFRSVGNYLVAGNDDRPLAGIFQVQRPQNRPEARPRWFGYISVSSVSRAEKLVTNAGGRVIAAPKSMPKRGEQAVFADPEGAIFGALKSSSGDPEDFLPEPGDWIWMQLLSLDGEKSSRFYADIAGYTVAPNTAVNGLSDYVLISKGYARATVRTIKDPQKVRPTWLPFVRVKDVKESAAKAEQLGGKILLAPRPDFLEGKLAVIADPTGAEIGIMEWTPAAVKGGAQ